MSRKSNFRLYRVWDGIIQRCCNPNAKNYHNYGGRGIFVCDEWRNDFSVFEEYCISNGWKDGLQIDRVDNDGNYCPGNIRFITQAENLRNKRTNHMMTFNGETLCAADWCERLGIDDSTLWRRLTSGWSVEDALTKPRQKRTYRKMGGGTDDGEPKRRGRVMERLTIRNSDGSVSQPMDLRWADALNRLAAYEDTGLEPREISAAMKDGTYAQFQKWNRAHYEGRLLVLPTVKTNADKIRQMSDEELAFYIFNHPQWVDLDGYLNWLKQEVESDG